MKKHVLKIRTPEAGFSLVEMLVTVVVSAIVLGAGYRLWLTHTDQGYRLGKKIDLRNEITLSSKKLQRDITLAGSGLHRAANLAKDDAVGSDTLTLYTNVIDARTALNSKLSHGDHSVDVFDISIFSGVKYIAVGSGTTGEVRRITGVEGGKVRVDSAFNFDYPDSNSLAYPCSRERYYTNQDSTQFIREINGVPGILSRNIRNFQVSFRDDHGASTEVLANVRTVEYSFTGIYPATDGALNAIVFSSTAIPRNTQ